MVGQRSANPLPLYAKVKQHILDGVARGKWTDGARLPSEHELREALGVSRMTIHRALREMSDDGLVTRVQGVGTFLSVPKLKSPLVEIVDIADDIKSRGHTHTTRLITLESLTANVSLSGIFGVRVGAKLFHSVVVHLENGIAVQLEERYVSPFFAPRYLQQDFTANTTTQYLRAISPATEVENQVTAIRPDAATCRLLNIDLEEACLQLSRRTWVSGTPTTQNYFTYPGSRYMLGSRYRLADLAPV